MKLFQLEESRPGLQLAAKRFLFALAAGVGKGVLCGLAGVIVVGIGARIAMRIMALTAGNDPVFTFGGTMAILFPTAVFGIILGLIFVFLRKWLPGSGLWKGLAFGLIILLLVGIIFIFDEVSNTDSNLREGPVLVGIGFFAPFLVAFGVMMEGGLQILRRAGLR